MGAIEQLHAELTLKLDEIVEICGRYQYDVTPSILLRHDDGARKSILIGNDRLPAMVLCIAELGDIGERSDMSPHEAVLRLFKGDSE